MIEAIGVVVPARNEELLLPACLASLAAAAAHPGLGALVRVVVVLDGCTDGSAEVVGGAGAEVVTIAAGNVGIARAAGVAEVLLHSGIDPERLWLAMTDADTTVPVDWLVGQLALADAGADVVVGTVQVDGWEEHPAVMAQRFATHYATGLTGSSHSHVHGANLGVRASVYLAAGGVAAVPLAEDHALVEACAAVGATVLRTVALPVTTSARRAGRAPGGFADLLVGLSADQTIT